MVYLTMTPAIVAVVRSLSDTGYLDAIGERTQGDPMLHDPAVGRPITHEQVLKLFKMMKKICADQSSREREFRQDLSGFDLDALLRGSRVYIEPPKPKPEPSSEYKALMARLRREEEQRAYERMIQPQAPAVTSVNLPNSTPDPWSYKKPDNSSMVAENDEEVTYADVNRQVALIINVLVSIFACGAAIWMVAWHWSVPIRLSASMGGGSLVGIAEVVIYAGYIRRVKTAKIRARKEVEVKEIVKTWLIGSENNDESHNAHTVVLPRKKDTQVRERIKANRKG